MATEWPVVKHLPHELRDNFERLWNNQHKRNVKIPATTDRVTRSMTTRGNVKSLTAKSTRLKVKDVSKSQHSAKWVEAINIEVNSLINNFKCLIPEEIEQQLTSTKLECVDVGMSWCKVPPTQTKLTLPQ